MAKRILIVDDDPGVLLAAQRILEAAGYEVQTAASTTEARKRLAARLPDLILLDVVMPSTDGFTFSEELGRDPRSRQIPIILCTVVADSTSQMMRAFEADHGLLAREILSKADLNDRLLDAVASALQPAATPVAGDSRA